jgi:predicted DNA-binding transcriptional regulator YafY
MARTDRLLRLVQILRRHRAPVTAAALAEELGVSLRSIYRDIGTLRGQGASIEGEAGVGYLLRPGFFLPPLMFEDEELEAIVLGLRLVVQHGDIGLGRAAAEVVAKLRAVLPRDLRVVVEETGLLAGPPGERPAESVDLGLVRRCLREQRKARITYVDKHGARTDRVIWPVALGFFESLRILIAWSEEKSDYRMFRTDRIGTFTPLAERIGRARAALLAEWRAREGIPPQLAS